MKSLQAKLSVGMVDFSLRGLLSTANLQSYIRVQLTLFNEDDLPAVSGGFARLIARDAFRFM
jgi:hypothetical protein